MAQSDTEKSAQPVPQVKRRKEDFPVRWVVCGIWLLAHDKVDKVGMRVAGKRVSSSLLFDPVLLDR